VLHPADAVVIAIKPATIRPGTIHLSDNIAIIIVATDVNTSKATVFGFVTST
jgi:hypothetical protein